jgi:tight adherence protein C
MVAAVLAAGGLAAGGRSRLVGGGAAAAILLIPPPVTLLAVLAGLGWALHRRVTGRRPPSPDGVLLLADLIVLGLRAGLTLEASLRAALPDLPPAAAVEVRALLRSARRRGMSEALQEAAGSASRIWLAAARAVATGAPLAASLEALAGEMRSAANTVRVEAARRLPVRMLLPLALLILPGFVLVVVGPALLGSLARLNPGW